MWNNSSYELRDILSLCINSPDHTDKKVERQFEVFDKADLIFSVGPKLTKSANDIVIKINKDIKIVELIPQVLQT